MGKDREKEVVVPSGLEHFVAGAYRTWRGLQGIDGQLSDDGEIFRSMVLAAAAGVLVEQNVENPVQVVLDAPVGAHDVEQFLGRQQARSQKVSDPVLGSLAGIGTPTVDAANGSDSGEAVLLCQLWCGRDDGLPALAATVNGSRALACPPWLAGSVEQRLGGLKSRPRLLLMANT
jgi:hypothetical protein